VEQMIAKIKNLDADATARLSSSGGDLGSSNKVSHMTNAASSITYTGARGVDPDLILEIEKFYGFDKPAHTRFIDMIKNYAVFDFGQSFYKDRAVVDLVIEKMPVSISLGLWTTLLVYLISIPLGIRKAIKDGSAFDVYSSALVSVGYAIPGFLFAIILVVLFAGGSYWQIFPLRGLVSSGWDDMSVAAKILDYLWHIILPVLAMVISGFAGLTMLTKNSFLEEIGKQYVVTARAKGLSENKVLYGHVFRNAMLIVVAGFPSAFVGILFTGSLLIETIFSLDGLGLLGFESVVNRDYPVVFGTLFFFTFIGLILNLIGDLAYRLIDPRIDFERRDI
jgi:microcin C transport system permease protein